MGIIVYISEAGSADMYVKSSLDPFKCADRFLYGFRTDSVPQADRRCSYAVLYIDPTGYSAADTLYDSFGMNKVENIMSQVIRMRIQRMEVSIGVII